MNLWLGFLVGIKEIWAHKFRSFLTMSGVILGVASLISMFALTAGIAKGMREFMQQIGGIERVGVNNQEVPTEQVGYWEISPGRTVADAEAIAKSVPLVSYVTPVSELGNAAIGRAGQTMRGQVNGCWPDFVQINKHVVAQGRSLSVLDVEQGLRVCVIGQSVVQKLWPERPGFDPTGEMIRINDRPFKVVGAFEFYEREEDKRRRELGLKGPSASGMGNRPRGGGGGGGRGPFERKNSTVIIPITTMFWEFKSTNVVGTVDTGPQLKLDALTFQVADTDRFEETIQQVQAVLETTHRGINDFTFETRQEWFDSMEQSARSTRVSFGFIAGISLLVGGLGITNIMLASITERIREIGVRRAVGAKGRDIFTQILVESAVVGVIGGLLGLVASAGMIRILIALSPEANAPVVELESILISFGFAVLIGIVSGIYPAWMASRLDPIEALRYG